ncbi:hypothetical protein [Legionella hackeliae]|uniref:C-type lysozyme inhibitor domain-containing protein n=1 Tax=Legionella hackeliae TaxID=449 RepID=A0A0A8USA2_LEGHA|nr:hypothetical protein [Legionella hackeliae]KTD14206.1 hypothetical protein Lhac_0518 [Legionella hackeliae]CEK10416.1 conserved exported protein of unknown function [Legionella hackeliae]STX47151.1 Uncharacterised protein [Legionella hackeliae]
MKILKILLFFFLQITLTHAEQKRIVCSLQGLKESISFVMPQKAGELPSVDFSYPLKTSVFSMREGNLLLIAMDEEDSSRLRIFISAQDKKHKNSYEGQFMTDSGGNQLQLDNGPTTCTIKG